MKKTIEKKAAQILLNALKKINNFLLKKEKEKNRQTMLQSSTRCRRQTMLQSCRAANSADNLLYDFQFHRNLIRHKNKEAEIQRMIKAVRKAFLKSDGLLITDEQAYKTALESFTEAVKAGKYDCLYKRITV